MKAKRRYVRGRDRVGGYYGRFTPGAGELKFHDVDLDDATIAAGGTITPTICAIPQGVTESERIGRKCTITQIMWKWRVTLPNLAEVTNPNDGNTFRLILYQDKQCNGATALALDILETAEVHGFRNLANTGRFNILYDKLWAQNYIGVASEMSGNLSQLAVIKEGTFYKKGCSIPLEFNASTGAITEIRSNNIGVLVMGLFNKGVLTSNVRLRFSDN